jgi:2-iminobutanoate/2-iminopropanoate deaminase
VTDSTSSLRVVHTDEAPAAVGPYSQAVCVGQLVFVSGQLPIDPLTGEFAGPGIREEGHSRFATGWQF